MGPQSAGARDLGVRVIQGQRQGAVPRAKRQGHAEHQIHALGSGVEVVGEEADAGQIFRAGEIRAVEDAGGVQRIENLAGLAVLHIDAAVVVQVLVDAHVRQPQALPQAGADQQAAEILGFGDGNPALHLDVEVIRGDIHRPQGKAMPKEKFRACSASKLNRPPSS